MLVLIALNLGWQVASGFYLPGVAPKDYPKGSLVPLVVNSLDAEASLLPYDYYHPEFHFCTPKGGPVAVRESFGSSLFGDRLFSSPFEVLSLTDETCKQLCTATIPIPDAKFVSDRIVDKYIYNWLIDGLPAATVYTDNDAHEDFYSAGFALGSVETENGASVSKLNNHYDITVHYHLKDNDVASARVVGVTVAPYSLAVNNCNTKQLEGVVIDPTKSNEVKYTYSVTWFKDPSSWGTRWDHYLHVFDPQIHWFSIINSIVIVFILSSMVSMILLRALHRDISRYNTLGDEDGATEEFGWKLIHADVFRPPSTRMLLTVMVGNGVQVGCMAAVTLLFAVLGFLSPSSRGALVTMSVVFYVLFSAIAGYVSAVLYKTLQGEHWRQNVFLTSFLVSGVVFAILLILNFVLIGFQSSAAVPFSTLFALVAMWFLISIPLSIIGGFFGYRHPGFDYPCKTNQIPRQVPPQPFYLHPVMSALIGGVLPFGAIFIELYFIMSSIWSHRVYYMFGFLFVVFLILVVTCALVSILICYFQLCAEDYNWSWRAFLTSGASGFYVFVYSAIYYAKQMHLDNTASAVIFFSWSLVLSFAFAVFTGSIGYISSFLFVRTIYAAIKVD